MVVTEVAAGGAAVLGTREELQHSRGLSLPWAASCRSGPSAALCCIRHLLTLADRAELLGEEPGCLPAFLTQSQRFLSTCWVPGWRFVESDSTVVSRAPSQTQK